MRTRLLASLLGTLMVLLAACSSSSSSPTPTQTVGGTVTGMPIGGSIQLQLNTGEIVTVFLDGSFTFSTKIERGKTYGVTVQTAPANAVCTVTNGSGTIGSANITNVQIACAPALPGPFDVNVSLTGLPGGEQVVLRNNGGDDLTMTADGVQAFATQLNNYDPYNVTVLTQPTTGAVTLTGNAGVIYGADVTVDAVFAVGLYVVGGVMTGLPAGSTATLQNNGCDDLVVTMDGPFAFATAQADLSPYAVTVLDQPVGANCTITMGGGNIAGAHVTNVAADCVLNTYTVSGTLSGLPAGQQVTLQNNLGDDLPVLANGPFTFTTPVPHLGAYDVTVLAQPVGALCTITNGSGFIAAANVTDVIADCPQFTVGGMLTGLPAGDSVVLQNNGGDDLTLSANGAFTFSPIYDGQPYAVTILTQPTGAICYLTNDTGTLAGANVTDVTADCPTYTVGGTLAGLPVGAAVTLQNNGGDDLTLSADGVFTFATGVYDGQAYAVTVSTQPTSAYCYLEMESGTIASANVTDVAADVEDAADFLIGYDTATPFTLLHQIDATDGSSTALSHSGLGLDEVQGLARDPSTGTVWGVRNIVSTSSSELVTVNLTAGTATTDVAIIGANNLLGAAFDSSTSTLYAMDDTTDDLVSINAAGVATVVGNPGGGGPGTSTIHSLAFDGAGQLYAYDATSRRLLWLNETDGSVQANFQLNGTPDITGMAWDAAGSRLIAFNATQNALYELVPGLPGNATVAVLGDAGTGSVGGMCENAAGEIFGATSLSNAALWQFETAAPANGVWGNAIGTSRVSVITGMAYDSTGGVAYGVAQPTNQLVSIDSATGETVVVADLNAAIEFRALAWDSNASVLYGIEEVPAGLDRLYSINTTTGAETLAHQFANAAWDINGVSFDARTDTLWLVAEAAGDDELLSLDLAGGAPFAPAVLEGVLTGAAMIHGLAWDGGRNALLGAAQSTGQHIQIDPATQLFSALGALSADFGAWILEP